MENYFLGFINIDNHCVISSPLNNVSKLDTNISIGFNADDKLQFKEHMHEKINKAYMMLGLVNRNFRHMSISAFVALCKSMVRSYLDNCCPVWPPFRKGDIEALENVQKRATKLIPALKKLSLQRPFESL